MNTPEKFSGEIRKIAKLILIIIVAINITIQETYAAPIQQEDCAGFIAAGIVIGVGAAGAYVIWRLSQIGEIRRNIPDDPFWSGSGIVPGGHYLETTLSEPDGTTGFASTESNFTESDLSVTEMIQLRRFSSNIGASVASTSEADLRLTKDVISIPLTIDFNQLELALKKDIDDSELSLTTASYDLNLISSNGTVFDVFEGSVTYERPLGSSDPDITVTGDWDESSFTLSEEPLWFGGDGNFARYTGGPLTFYVPIKSAGVGDIFTLSLTSNCNAFCCQRVPEPSTTLLLVAGLFGIAGFKKRYSFK